MADLSQDLSLAVICGPRHEGSAQLRLGWGNKMSHIPGSAHIKVWTLDHMPFHCVLPTLKSSA